MIVSGFFASLKLDTERLMYDKTAIFVLLFKKGR